MQSPPGNSLKATKGEVNELSSLRHREFTNRSQAAFMDTVSHDADAAAPSTLGAPCPSVRKVSGFRWRGLLGALVLAPSAMLVMLSRPVFVSRSLEEQFLDVGGWVFFLVYVAWRLWATLFIGGRKDRELQTEGPYSVCR